MTYKAITNLIPTMQAASLLSNNIPKKGKKQNIVKTGITNVIGLSLIKETAQLTGSL